jgi:hypothetical protein
MLSGATTGNLLLKQLTVNVPLVHREYATGHSIASHRNIALAVQIPEGAIGRKPHSCPIASKQMNFVVIIYEFVTSYIRASIRSLLFILCIVPAAIHTGSASLVDSGEVDQSRPPTIVIGFVGGFVKHDAMVHSAVQVAAHLRQTYPSGVQVEVIENHHREKAYAEIIRFVDSNRDGRLSPEEKRNARIILYGHSWGASETVTLARQLNREGIPVLLTVQVDSVAKPGENDKLIPANVAEAANFYQENGLLHGETRIRAAEPERTRILGNFRFDYSGNPLACKEYPWYDRLFMKAHTEIECDPKVWGRVESLIAAKLSQK